MTNIVSFDKHDGYFTNIVRFDKPPFSVKPTDTRVDEWNLAEIPLVDPKFSLLRVKVSEISPSETRGISDSFSRNSENFESTSEYFISQIQQVQLWVSVGFIFYTTTIMMRFDQHSEF